MGANFRSTLANRPMSDLSLDELVSEFQAELVESLSAFTGEEPTLEIVAEANRVVVRLAQDDEASPGIVPLRAEGDDLIGISFDYKCSWDSASRYLAIESSSIGVHTWARKRGAPLFRFEYCRSPKTAGIPSSHFHVHAHRDEFTHLLGHGGRGTRIARKRADRSLSDKIPAVSEVHFPTGARGSAPLLKMYLRCSGSSSDCLQPSTGSKDLVRPGSSGGRTKWRRLSATRRPRRSGASTKCQVLKSK